MQRNECVCTQVRCLTEVLLMVGRGDEQPDIVRQLLNVEAVPQKPQYLMAPEASSYLSRAPHAVVGSLAWERCPVCRWQRQCTSST
jgi:tRNA U38,U39,U40 pseudouridine synthase TruA